MSARVPRLGEIKAVTGVNGVTFVCVDWRTCMLGITPATARELAAALLAVADDAEAIDAETSARPVQDALWEAS